MKKDIVKILTAQHDELREGLKTITGQKEKEINKIHKELANFTEKLAKHLKLENDHFYPHLLKKMSNHGMDIEKTKDFIKKIKDLEVTVHNFLEEFNSKKDIKDDFHEFKKSFKLMKQGLVLRIDAEEDSIYMYWKILKSNK